MARVYYSIVRMSGSGWAIRHDGKLAGDYATREAAFEAAVGQASNAIREGHAVTVSIEGSEAHEPAL